jgi:uncharacterized protein YqeY
MGLAQDLQTTTLYFRKERSELAPGFQSVMAFAQASAKERALKGGDPTVNDEDALRAIQRGIKMCKDTLEAAGDAESDSILRTRKELHQLELLLPAMASDDEVRAAAEKFVAENEIDPKKGMGQVMAHLTATFGTSLNKSEASRIAREALVTA